jgi:hypothetical protein
VFELTRELRKGDSRWEKDAFIYCWCDGLQLTHGLSAEDGTKLDRDRFCQEMQALFFDASSEADFNDGLALHWDHHFCERRSKRATLRGDNAWLPVFWALDTVIHHEISHVNRGHVELFASQEVDENTARYAEAWADAESGRSAFACFEHVRRLATTGEGCDCTAKHCDTIALFGQSPFLFMRADRPSLRLHSNFRHPHPDFRRELFFYGMSLLMNGFGPQWLKLWRERRNKMKLVLNHALPGMGIAGLDLGLFDLGLLSASLGDEAGTWDKEIRQSFISFLREMGLE